MRLQYDFTVNNVHNFYKTLRTFPPPTNKRKKPTTFCFVIRFWSKKRNPNAQTQNKNEEITRNQFGWSQVSKINLWWLLTWGRGHWTHHSNVWKVCWFAESVAFAMKMVDGTNCKTCFGCPWMVFPLSNAMPGIWERLVPPSHSCSKTVMMFFSSSRMILPEYSYISYTIIV